MTENMSLKDAVNARHSVREYTDKPLGSDVAAELNREIEACNRESGLHIQLITEEPKAFDSFMAHYGKFSGVKNYIALIGKKAEDLEEKCGYYGERLVLRAQQMGLNSCWVAMTYSKIKDAYKINDGEKLCLVIALGYGKAQGTSHSIKAVEAVAKADNMPSWFKEGVECALLAPTAMNQQRFTFELKGDKVAAKPGLGFYTKVDLGIVKYHFELGAGKENFKWE